MKRIGIVIVTAIYLLTIGNVKAQTLAQPSDVTISLEPTSDILILDDVSDTLLDIFNTMEGAGPMAVNLSMNIQDSLNISSIIVKVGRSVGVYDIIDYSFPYDGAPSTGLTYEREGFNVFLGLGEHSNVETLYYEIFFQDANGGNSAIVLGGNTE